jgi:hypothetical protein
VLVDADGCGRVETLNQLRAHHSRLSAAALFFQYLKNAPFIGRLCVQL